MSVPPQYNRFLKGAAPAQSEGFWPFVKMHGLENCFVIIDRRDSVKDFDAQDIIRICSSSLGAGGEQLLTLEKPSCADAYAAMRIFNIDGIEVGACGNATRCAAYLLLEEAGIDEIGLETLAGVLLCRRADKGMVSVTLGPVSERWDQIPLSSDVDTRCLPLNSGPLSQGTALNIGNPHVTYFVDELKLDDIPLHAPAVASDPLFPDSVNVGFAQIVDETTIKLAVWERPGILTRACGTGACVAAYAAAGRGLVKGDRIDVDLPAGRLHIELLPHNMVRLTGPIAFCCHGYISAKPTLINT